MKDAVVAAIGGFLGVLVWETLFGDGLQVMDFSEALFIAAIAALIQFWLTWRGRR